MRKVYYYPFSWMYYIYTSKTGCVASYMNNRTALSYHVWSPPPYSVVWTSYACVPSRPLKMKYCSGCNLPIYAFWRMYAEGLWRCHKTNARPGKWGVISPILSFQVQRKCLTRFSWYLGRKSDCIESFQYKQLQIFPFSDLDCFTWEDSSILSLIYESSLWYSLRTLLGWKSSVRWILPWNPLYYA